MPLRAHGAALSLLVFCGALVVLREGEAVFVPLLVSVLLAYALDPFVALLTRIGIPRVIAVLVIYLIIAASALTLTRVAREQAIGFIDDLPSTITALKSAFTDRTANPRQPGGIERLQRAATDVQATVSGGGSQPPAGVQRVTPEKPHLDVRGYLYHFGLTALSLTGRLAIIALLTFLLLVTGDFYKRKLVKFAGPRWEDRKLTVDVIRTIDRQIERYLVVRLFISVLVGVATAIGLSWVGMAHAVVWGIIAGALNTLPFIGPMVAIALIALAAFLEFHDVESTVAAGGVAAIVAALEGNLVSPWLTGRAGELNTVAVFVSVLFWGWMWDIWGLLLAVPITVAIKAAADHIEPLQPVGELLGR